MINEKNLVSYLREFERQYRNINYCVVKSETDKQGNQKPVYIDEYILFNASANRIEYLESKLKELEKIDKVLKLLESEDE